MSISVAFIGKVSAAERTKAFVNLCEVMMELQLHHLVLLHSLFPEVELRERVEERARVNGAITLEVAGLLRFRFSHTRRISDTQRRIVAALKRQVFYRIDEHMGFSQRRAWRAAARVELVHWDRLARTFPEADIPILATKAHARDRWLSGVRGTVLSWRDWLSGYVSPESRLLAEILLVREISSRTEGRDSGLAAQVRGALPVAWEQVQRFDEEIVAHATQIAIGQFPQLSDQPLAALAAMRKTIQISRTPEDSTDLTRG